MEDKYVDWTQLARIDLSGRCEHSGELPGFLKGPEILDELNDYKLHTKASVPWN